MTDKEKIKAVVLAAIGDVIPDECLATEGSLQSLTFPYFDQEMALRFPMPPHNPLEVTVRVKPPTLQTDNDQRHFAKDLTGDPNSTFALFEKLGNTNMGNLVFKKHPKGWVRVS